MPYWREEGEPDYRQPAVAAQRFGKVPQDKRLVLERVRGGELEIRLEDAAALRFRDERVNDPHAPREHRPRDLMVFAVVAIARRDRVRT